MFPYKSSARHGPSLRAGFLGNFYYPWLPSSIFGYRNRETKLNSREI